MLFVTEESGIVNLRREGIADEKIHFVGNTMIDSLLAYKDKPTSRRCSTRWAFAIADPATDRQLTRCSLLHRPSNVDDRETFLSILEGLDDLASSCPIMFSAHPRTRKRIAEFGLEQYFHFDGGRTPAAAPAWRTSYRTASICSTRSATSILCA